MADLHKPLRMVLHFRAWTAYGSAYHVENQQSVDALFAKYYLRT